MRICNIIKVWNVCVHVRTRVYVKHRMVSSIVSGHTERRSAPKAHIFILCIPYMMGLVIVRAVIVGLGRLLFIFIRTRIKK